MTEDDDDEIIEPTEEQLWRIGLRQANTDRKGREMRGKVWRAREILRRFEQVLREEFGDEPSPEVLDELIRQFPDWLMSIAAKKRAKENAGKSSKKRGLAPSKVWQPRVLGLVRRALAENPSARMRELLAYIHEHALSPEELPKDDRTIERFIKQMDERGELPPKRAS